MHKSTAAVIIATATATTAVALTVRYVLRDFQAFKRGLEVGRTQHMAKHKADIRRDIENLLDKDDRVAGFKVVELDGPPTRENIFKSLGEFLDQVPGLDMDDKAREGFASMVDGMFGESVTPVPPVVLGTEEPGKEYLVDGDGTPQAYKVVQPDDTETEVKVCTNEGHLGQEVVMHDNGVCPDAWEHVTDWERENPPTGKVIPLKERIFGRKDE